MLKRAEPAPDAGGIALRQPAFLPAVLAVLMSVMGVSCRAEVRPEMVSVPEGFSVELYARVPNARSLALGKKGTVFVGNRKGDSVYAVTSGEDGKRTVRVLARGLDSPNGVAFRGGDLYVAEVSRIIRFPGIEDRLDGPPPYEVVAEGFPTDRSHGWKYIAFGPDGMLYVPVGAPCNVCERPDPYASIMRLDVATGRREVYARGVRNTVGFDWRPGTGELWFTNNGRDWMGDDSPPDSLNSAPAAGLDFGFPYCHSGTPDPDLGRDKDCASFAPPALKLPAHVAALGMKFYTGSMFPEKYRGQAFIAEHGSWNRSTPVGYRVTLATFRPDGSMGYETFASGWLRDGRAWGRPVDVLVMPDGALLVSDDHAGAVYRISHSGR
ncbi:MAG: PQQ-dependent sugar dehydrogenase [Thermodesulfobacteriota bacterium]